MSTPSRSPRRRPVAVATTLLAAATVVSGMGLAGCANKRPVDDIRASGRQAFVRGDWNLALAEYGEIIDRYPGDWRAQHQYGMTSLQLGDWSSAELALKTAHEVRPDREDIADAYAEALFRNGERERLVAFLVGQTDPETAGEGIGEQDWLRMAIYQRLLGDLDASLVAIETAIRLHGQTSPAPYVEAHRLALLIGDRETALRRLRQAYGIRPTDIEITQAIRDLDETPGPSFALPPGV